MISDKPQVNFVFCLPNITQFWHLCNLIAPNKKS